MASFNNCRGQFSQYDDRSTEELQQLLREDASKPEGQGLDMDELFYVMDVLAKRRKAQNEGKTPEEALASFKRYYHPNIHNISSPESPEPIRKSANWRRSLIAAAAVLVILISSTITADAWGYDLWDTVAKWTKETFHFGYAGQTEPTNAPTPERSYPYTALQEALDKGNVTVKLAPTWIPDGYVETSVDVIETPRQRQFIASFQRNNESLFIRICEHLTSHPVQMEKSDDVFEIYTANGIDYYIMKNENFYAAAWIVNTYECYISGSVSIDQLKAMIDSIEKG